MASIAAQPLSARRPLRASGRTAAAGDPIPFAATRRWLSDLSRWTSDLFLIVSLVSFLGLALGPWLFDYRTVTMITGSMAPYIDPGDVIVIRPIAPGQLSVGDVISYQIPLEDHRIVTHRVVAVNKTPAGMIFQTKGDANTSADPWMAQVMGNQVWTVRTVIPVIGNAIRWLRDPYVSRMMRLVVPWFLVLSTLQVIWGYGRPGRPAGRPAGPRPPARPLSRSLPVGARNPFAVSVYPRPGRRRQAHR